MKRITDYILVAIAACVCFASCLSIEDDFTPASGQSDTFEVMASVADFSKLNVGTKALEDDEKEVNEITMAIFDANGDVVGRPVNLTGSNSIFMIETQSNNQMDPDAKPYIINGTERIEISNTQEALNNCTIYMVANCWSVLEKATIGTVADLASVKMPVTGIVIPESGFPMIGSQTGIDLSKDRSDDATNVADIPMDKLYSKVNVRFQINAEQVIKTPTFTLTGWTVSNVPTDVALGIPSGQTVNAEGAVLPTSKESTILSAGRPTISHSESTLNPDYMQFTFYMPEHKVTSNKTVTYPKDMPEAERQRYKPLLCEDPKKPAYVTVNGTYTDHHGQVKEVTYSLYLGQDNWSNFDVLRNQELNNIITIKGLTNSKDAVDWVPEGGEDNISVDHRVEVENKGFSVAIEREALLDSHFEVRPMDVFVSAGGKVVVTVNSDDAVSTDDWLRIEKSYGGNASNNSATNATYIQNVGVRKYFTTDLVTATLKETGRSVTISAGDDSRIWLYFDENTGVYDKTLNDGKDPMYRDITLTLAYYDDASADITSATPTETQTFSFRQMNLWRVRNADNTRYYDIEYHEEYLHNYVSNDNYGKTTDGMAWGLNGITFSGNMGDEMKTQAVVIQTSGWSSDIIDGVIDQVSPFYDFYLPREAAEISSALNVLNNEYAGRRFTNAIIDADVDGTATSYSAIGLIKRELNDDPESAIEYCLNKNRRSSSGTVTTRNWYLPAIDEIEEIMVAGYTDFAVFQNKMYWSCQPAFHKNFFRYSSTILSDKDFIGDYYYESETSARATNAVYINNNKYNYAGSGVINDGYYELCTAEFDFSGGNSTITAIPTNGVDVRYKISNGILGWGAEYNEVHLNQVKYDVGYDSRSTDINRIRCVRNSGLTKDL